MERSITRFTISAFAIVGDDVHLRWSRWTQKGCCTSCPSPVARKRCVLALTEQEGGAAPSQEVLIKTSSSSCCLSCFANTSYRHLCGYREGLSLPSAVDRCENRAGSLWPFSRLLCFPIGHMTALCCQRLLGIWVLPWVRRPSADIRNNMTGFSIRSRLLGQNRSAHSAFQQCEQVLTEEWRGVRNLP